MSLKVDIVLPVGRWPGSETRAVNAAGEAVLGLPDRHRQQLVRWKGDELSDLDQGRWPFAEALHLGDDGQIAGYVQDDDAEARTHAAVWQDGELRLLAACEGHSAACQVRGEVVVGSNGEQACVWVTGQPQMLDIPGASSSVATGVAADGTIVGSCGLGNGGERAFIVTPNRVVEVLEGPDDGDTWLNGITAGGMAYGGTGQYPGACQPVVVNLARCHGKPTLRVLPWEGNALGADAAGHLVGVTGALPGSGWVASADHIQPLVAALPGEAQPRTLLPRALAEESGFLAASAVVAETSVAAVARIHAGGS